MAQTKEITPEEAAEKKRIADVNRKMSGFKRTLKTQAGERGVRSIELELEWLKDHPTTTQLKKPALNYDQHVMCYEEAISEFKEEYTPPPQ